MNRLCIYITYDKQYIIDRYIGYMLKELKTCVSHLVVVCNMPKIARGKEHIDAYADEVFFRENKGFDAGAYKDTLCQMIGWDKVKEYDELVLVNDSFFGPFVPMKNIFAEMQERNCDFWSLTKHGEKIDSKGRVYIREHLQSFFLVVRKELLHHACFREFWEERDYSERLWEAIRNFEITFTQYFSGKGFSYACLADMKPNDPQNKEHTFNQYHLLPYELITKRNFPFVKRKAFTEHPMGCHTSIRKALDYIKNQTAYDSGMILEKLIRDNKNSVLQLGLGLRYIISDNAEKESVSKDNYVVLVQTSHGLSYEYMEEYIAEFDAEEKFFISDKEGLKNSLVNIPSNVEYICVIQDEDTSSEKYTSYLGKTLLARKWENLIKSKTYVEQVLQLFEGDSYLGALSIPAPNFREYFGNFWQNVEQPKYPMYESFWVRRNLLDKWSEMQMTSFDELEDLLRESGYYAGIVESAEYAAMNEANLECYLTRICNLMKNNYGEFTRLKELEMLLYCGAHKQVYIYGTGIEAEKYSSMLHNIKAYVVSDGQPKKEEFNNRSVLYLSELQMEAGEGIVVCMNGENASKVKFLLEQAGITDYFTIAEI